MYSEKLKLNKVSNNGKDYNFIEIEIDKEEVIKHIDLFCKKDDIIGVPVKVVSDLFYEFCEENNIPKISPIIFGKIIREHFDISRKRIRCGDNILWVYVNKG